MDEIIPKDLLSHQSKIEIAKIVASEGLTRFRNPAIVWSAGKDSTVMLHIAKLMCENLNRKLPPAIFIDHGDHYDETLKLVNDVSENWNFKVIFAKNEDFLKNVVDGYVNVESLNEKNRDEIRRIGFSGAEIPYSLETDVGNHLLKTVPMNDAIRNYRFDALLVGVRRDENKARSSESFVSKRENPEHYRVHPVLTFSEKDIWDYTFSNKIPYHPLYSKGYRSIDGKNDSKKTSDLPAWEQDLEKTSERAGRAQDKENMMERLRKLGYM